MVNITASDVQLSSMFAFCKLRCDSQSRWRHCKDTESVPNTFTVNGHEYTVIKTSNAMFVVTRVSGHVGNNSVMYDLMEDVLDTYPQLGPVFKCYRAYSISGCLPVSPPANLVTQNPAISQHTHEKISKRWRQYFWETYGQQIVYENGQFEIRGETIDETQDSFRTFVTQVVENIEMQVD